VTGGCGSSCVSGASVGSSAGKSPTTPHRPRARCARDGREAPRSRLGGLMHHSEGLQIRQLPLQLAAPRGRVQRIGRFRLDSSTDKIGRSVERHPQGACSVSRPCRSARSPRQPGSVDRLVPPGLRRDRQRAARRVRKHWSTMTGFPCPPSTINQRCTRPEGLHSDREARWRWFFGLKLAVTLAES
jgi:hypothetical protein